MARASSPRHATASATERARHAPLRPFSSSSSSRLSAIARTKNREARRRQPFPPISFHSRRLRSRKGMVAMLPAARGDAAPAASAGAAEKLLHGPLADGKCKKKAPRMIHKAEREKHKRDLLNDLFSELGEMLEADRQTNGKACILTDTTRILRDLLSQLESLRKENSTLQNESHYVTMERNELQDENSVLRNEILELQKELTMPHAVSHSANTVFPSQQPMQPATIASAVFPLQQPLLQTTILEHPYAPPPPPRELKLFPDAASDVEGLEPSEDPEATNHITRPLARYPTESASWPVTVSLGLPRMEDEQCSSGTTGSSNEGSSSASSRD
ncbi:protein IRON-RELATED TRANSCRIPTION FACTOR 3 [Aegilops tauschii subsp. strangulata]|nr:protein IRON-RELATED TRANSCRIPTION FACTOR 3 [Aegilops tauschii subsp. strangulata]